MADCWICGEEAGSGEHIVKKSDLKARFGHVSSEKPIYVHLPHRRNIKVRGLKSDLLKSAAPMCANCNNERTQPYDFAWERLSSHLGRLGPARLRAKRSVRVHELFEGTVRKSLLDVHLFFIKAFGCKLVEGDAEIDLQLFRDGLLKRAAHPNVFIAICPPFTDDKRRLGSWHIEAVCDEPTGRAVFATWLYTLDTVAVRVVYAEQRQRDRKGLIDTWHPDSVSSRLPVAENFEPEKPDRAEAGSLFI